MRSTAHTILARAALFLPLGLCLLAGCRSVPERTGPHVRVLHRGEIEHVRPMEVAIAPVINDSGNPKVPVEALRAAFPSVLVKRRYTPLALSFVDRQVVEATYMTGAAGEDAVLKVVVRNWDDSRWDSKMILEVGVEAWLEDSKTGAGKLWGGRLDRRFSLAQESIGFATDQAMFRHVCEQVAAELLDVMPARNPAP